MTKNYCDRCGEETYRLEGICFNHLSYGKIKSLYGQLELCPSCLKELKEWLKEKK